MPVWRVATIEQEPEVRLSNWRVMETASGTRHFVGDSGWSGRVSSAIQEFDPVALVGRTRSGRIYQLQGAPGYSENGEYVWNQWCYINKEADARDVTGDAVARGVVRVGSATAGAVVPPTDTLT